MKKMSEIDRQETIGVIKLISSEIAGGMSGGPIYDIKQEKVVGIASNYNYTNGNFDRDLAIAIPVKLFYNFFSSLKIGFAVTDMQKEYLEEVINEYSQEFQKHGDQDLASQKIYIENRNAALMDKAEDWEKTDEEIYQERKVKSNDQIIKIFLDDKTSVD